MSGATQSAHPRWGELEEEEEEEDRYGRAAANNSSFQHSPSLRELRSRRSIDDRLPPQDIAKKVAERSVNIKAIFEPWGRGQTAEECWKQVTSYPEARKEPYLREGSTFKINSLSYGGKVSGWNHESSGPPATHGSFIPALPKRHGSRPWHASRGSLLWDYRSTHASLLARTRSDCHFCTWHRLIWRPRKR